MADKLLVRATKDGLFGRIRKPGDEFELSDEAQFSKRWMEKISGFSKKKADPKPDGDPEELEALQKRADELGVKYQPNWGVSALTKHITAAQEQVLE